MRSLVLCYSAVDEACARSLGDFLEANLPLEVSYGECVVREDFDLVDAAERALSAEIALVLLSPDSVPKTWRRERWESVFLAGPAEFETTLGFVLLRDCRFPELLRRERFFDLSADFSKGRRQIKRWLLKPDVSGRRGAAKHTELCERIADFPGAVHDIPLGDALEFAAAYENDFEAVHRIEAADRSRAGIVGDVGHSLGLTLPGSAELNRAALIRHCRDHRYLFIFENARAEAAEFIAPGGRTSAIFTSPSLAPFPTLETVAGSFFCSPRDEQVCARLLSAATFHMRQLFATDFELALRLGWSLISVLKLAERFAEAVETLDAMAAAARFRGDTPALSKIEWELSWLRDGSDPARAILPTAASEASQLTFAFA